MAALRAERLAVILRLGGHCRRCGFGDIRALELNHIDRSRKLRPKVRYPNHILVRMSDLRQNEDNFEILCANCHRIETHETVWSKQKKASYFERGLVQATAAKVLGKL